MKKIISLLIICFSWVALSQNKVVKAEKLHSIMVDADQYFGFDVLENYYFEKNNVLIKKNPNQTWEYQNNALGKISSVDFKNPLRILVFYEEFNTLVFLDNQLNEIQKITFSLLDNPLFISRIGMATQNQIWAFDSALQQLFLYNYINNTRIEQCQPIKNKWLYSQSTFTSFYWISKSNTWESCSLVGKNKTIVALPNWDKIQFINDDRFVFINNGELFLKSTNSDLTYKIENVDNSFTNFYWRDQILSIFTNQQIINYKISIP